MFSYIRLRIIFWLWRREYLAGPKKLDVTLAKRKGRRPFKPGIPERTLFQ